MTEEPANRTASVFSHSGAMTANNSHASWIPRMRDVETVHHKLIFDINKRLSTPKTLVMSGFPARRPKIGFALHPTRILERFSMFSMRWALFGIFSSASIRVNLRQNDFSQASRNWLCLEKCRPAPRLEPPTLPGGLGITVNYSKESE
jgi:hypothetical protein